MSGHLEYSAIYAAVREHGIEDCCGRLIQNERQAPLRVEAAKLQASWDGTSFNPLGRFCSK